MPLSALADLKEPAMTEQFTTDADIRYTFAPNREPVEGIPYRVHVIFEEPNGRHSCRPAPI